MANANINKMPSRRTGSLRAIEGDGVPRQPLDLANLTVLQLRELLGEEYGPRLSDEGGEQVIKLVRGLAGQQAPPPADDGAWTLEKARAIAEAQPDTSTKCDWDVTAVMGALKTIDDALPNMIAWWTSLPPSDERQRGLAFFVQFAEALPALRFPLGGYKPRPSNQIGPNKKITPWWAPAVVLANTLDRVLRRPDDSELLPFSRESPLAKAIHTILEDLRLRPAAVSTVAGYLRRWWNKPESGGRLPLGATDGRQLLRAAVLNQAETPGAAEALDQLHRALLVREAELLRKEQLRRGTEERGRREQQADRPPSEENGDD